MPGIQYTQNDYNNFKVLLEDACGISLGENKQYLVESRLCKVMNEVNISNLGDLIEEMQSNRVHGLKETIIEAMTTNETLWFRDDFPFKLLKSTLFPAFEKEQKSDIAIWSAACSSGQEPYSISICTEEYLQDISKNLAKVSITATDISSGILKDAQTGTYDLMSLSRGLSDSRRLKYFCELNEQRWQANKIIQNRIRFRQHNLLQNFNSFGKFDIIFCRNVLIYFSVEGKKDILSRMAAVLNPGGYLFLGASESITGISDDFEMIHCKPGVIYQVKNINR